MSLARDGKVSEPNIFQRYIEAMGINNIKARVKHPQTNGKLERLNYTLKILKKYFVTWEEVVNHYNNERNHISLCDPEKVVTPAMAYKSKMPKEGEVIE